ncbi:hypothetical protein DESC_780238 [Desulfosarcina cetonica]|nr:hypothetical protein DESC_780238 [Desulfosarcina cetonica]
MMHKPGIATGPPFPGFLFRKPLAGKQDDFVAGELDPDLPFVIAPAASLEAHGAIAFIRFSQDRDHFLVGHAHFQFVVVCRGQLAAAADHNQQGRHSQHP